MTTGTIRIVGLLACALGSVAAGDAVVVGPGMHHLRSGAGREWDEFPEVAEGKEWVVAFDAKANRAEHTLRIRQRDVKQTWRVSVNGKPVGSLAQDENEIVAAWALAAGVLRDGRNELRVRCEAGEREASDDVMVGHAELLPRPPAAALGEATLVVELVDGDGARTPGRVTIVDGSGGLWTTASPSGDGQAVRPGVIYVAGGKAVVAISAGTYRVYGGRGFEYAVASEKVELAPGETKQIRLAVRRVVPTDGMVGVDTHVHTLTYSRHGDATLEERLVTVAGEGVGVAVATEHNLQIDFAAAAKPLTFQAFSTVIGNEVTTASLGHFNVFPVPPGAKLINWRGRDWAALSRSIDEVAPDSVVVLNHARDVHGGFAPFGAARHVSVAGESVDGTVPPANAMEVINSGATRADPMELFRDWFGMLNRGHRLAPIGASDSHDVARYIVGQARTYVDLRPASDPPAVDAKRVADGIRAGRVAVSYGLLTRLTVAGRFAPGDLASADGDAIPVDIQVLGPEWTTASRVALYANGVEVDHANIPHPAPDSPQPAPVKWQGRFTLPRPKHDVHLVAIATGPGVSAPYWPGAKPYQPTSPHFERYVLGASGAVFVDADGNGRFDSAFDYATRLVADLTRSNDELERLAEKLSRGLADYDEATAAQAASVLRARDAGRFEETCRRLIAAGPPPVSRGVATYVEQWKRTTH